MFHISKDLNRKIIAIISNRFELNFSDVKQIVLIIWLL